MRYCADEANGAWWGCAGGSAARPTRLTLRDNHQSARRAARIQIVRRRVSLEETGDRLFTGEGKDWCEIVTHGRLGDECLNEMLFTSPPQARAVRPLGSATTTSPVGARRADPGGDAGHQPGQPEVGVVLAAVKNTALPSAVACRLADYS